MKRTRLILSTTAISTQYRLKYFLIRVQLTFTSLRLKNNTYQISSSCLCETALICHIPLQRIKHNINLFMMKGTSAITLFILIHTWNCSAWKEMKRAFNQALYQSFILGVTWPLTHKKKLLGALIRIFTKTLLSKEILNRYCKVLQRVTTILFISNNCMSLISTSLFE